MTRSMFASSPLRTMSTIPMRRIGALIALFAIAGATGYGLDSCWVLDGIHGEELSDGNVGFDPAKTEAAARAAGMAPVAALPRFVW